MKELKKRQSLALLIATFAIGICTTSVIGQCRFRACNLEGERYDPSTRECRSGPDPFTRAESHRAATCPDGERFDAATGQCVLRACDEGCDVRSLCTRKEHYARSGRDRDGLYGVCEQGPDDITLAESHRLVRCPSGFTLNTARGVCVRCRAVLIPRLPDLVIRRAFLRLTSSAAEVTRIPAGRSYYACFEVANQGTAASGPFRVGGGGLGVMTPPGQNHASLLPGASREGCLTYSTTPPVGTYRLELRADSLDRVRETREDNNRVTLAVTVIGK